FPTMKAMLSQKKADLASFVAPFSFDPELKQIARPLFSQRDALGATQMIVWVARAGFLRKNRAAMVDFMEDSVRVVRWYLDPKNHDEAVQIAAKITKLPPRNCSRAGSSPTRNIRAARICCPIWRRCSPTSTCSATSDSSNGPSTCRH